MVKGISRRSVAIAAMAFLALAVTGVAVASPAQPRRPTAALSSLEQGVLTDINAFRTEHNLAPLRLSAPLTASARMHSQEMAAKGYFAHESPDGAAFWKRIKAVYPQSTFRFWSVGENLLWSSPDVTAAAALKLWLDSPEHRANLLAPAWREIGVSALHVTAAPGTFQGQDVTIVTTDFGVRR